MYWFIVCPVLAYLCGDWAMYFDHGVQHWTPLFFAYSECQKLWLRDTQLIIAGKGNPPRTNQVAMFLDQGLFEDTQSLFMSFLSGGIDKVIYLNKS